MDEEPAALHRFVISGAMFEDDSARDAQRGLVASGVDLSELITALLPGSAFLAFTEDGHPADMPADAVGIEAFTGYRAGGRSQEMRVRWQVEVAGLSAMQDLLGEDPSDRILGLALWEDDDAREAFVERLFLLTGLSTVDSPPARFQPGALPDLLDLVPVVLLFHRDKHSLALGIYTRERLPLVQRLELFAAKRGVLPVPFAIPPMLARWDRALAEARLRWEASSEEPFPVPHAEEPSRWARRSPRGRRDGRPSRYEDEDALLLVEGEEEE